MRTQFTDTHVQVESGNDIFPNGHPRQMVRRHFSGKGVVWFEKPITLDGDLDRVSDRSKAEQLERKFAEENGGGGRQILDPKDF